MIMFEHIKNDALFDLGEIDLFPGVDWKVEEDGRTVEEFLARHARGDWGDVHEEVKAHNDRELREGRDFTSHYDLPNMGRTLLITTDPERKTTTLWMAEEE
jgi:hypothetical protein